MDLRQVKLVIRERMGISTFLRMGVTGETDSGGWRSGAAIDSGPGIEPWVG